MEQYIVSARKYRPATFDTVVGQRPLTQTLLNAIRSGKLAHAYLFCGPRGVGKTTCARIFAKTINCEHLDEHGAPCGQCESCRAFEEGRSLNIHELDAASNNSVDDIRELIDQVRIPPQVGRYKVFIIDEVHMLSQAAFNAFLKTLEEPPHYVIFILATTEKHKILPTILSRCQVYDFARITLQSTVDHLKFVAEREGYTAEEEALSLIAQKADGGMRDALSIFDQMVSFTQGHITYQATLENLNILDADYYFRMVDHMLAKDVESSLLLYDEIQARGFDGGHFVAGLASHMRNLLVSRDARTLPLLETSEAQRRRYHEQAVRCRPQFLLRAIKLCNDCDQSYRQSRNKRLQVELCLIQAAQSSDDDTPGAGPRPAKTLKPIFKRPATPGVAPAAAQQSPSPRPAERQPQPQRPAKPAVRHTLTLGAASIRLGQPSVPTAPAALNPQPAATNPPPTAPGSPRPLLADELILAWQHYANRLPQSEQDMAVRMRGITPRPLSPDTFSVSVSNPLIERAFLKSKADIETNIAHQLGLPRVAMQLDVVKTEVAVKAFSKPDLFRQMLSESHSLKKLHETFSLEVD